MLTTHRLWATSAAYMNDRDEIRIGRKALLRALDERQPPLERWQHEQLAGLGVTKTPNAHEVFLLCASTKGDSLTLWRSYGVGSEAEYSVDLDPSVPLRPVLQSDALAHPAPAPEGWYEAAEETSDEGETFSAYNPDDAYSYGGEWAEVEYLSETSTAVKREVDSLLRELKEPPPGNHIMPFLLDYLAGPDPTVRFKDPGFEDEAEVRNTWTVHPWWRVVLYRPGRFGVTPYIEVAASDGAPTSWAFGRNILQPSDISPLPIRTIRIGPTRAAEDAKSSLRALLDANGYSRVKIEVSATPYR